MSAQREAIEAFLQRRQGATVTTAPVAVRQLVGPAVDSAPRDALSGIMRMADEYWHLLGVERQIDWTKLRASAFLVAAEEMRARLVENLAAPACVLTQLVLAARSSFVLPERLDPNVCPRGYERAAAGFQATDRAPGDSLMRTFERVVELRVSRLPASAAELALEQQILILSR
jgi:hypothetical protein